MDVRTVWTLLALCMTVTAEANPLSPAKSTSTPSTSKSPPTSSTSSLSTSTRCPCDHTPPNTLRPTATPPTLAILQVTWSKPCDGLVYLSVLQSESLPLCHSSRDLVLQHWTGVCQRPGCMMSPVWTPTPSCPGYQVLENNTLVKTTCQTLRVLCKAAPVEPDLRGQLMVYKVLTALLCVLFLLLLVARFGQPSLRVLQKRLSDRRQSRWIGPTQSQSVSYHRGKSTVETSDESKRSSFSALERLTVNYSREPSSNRNSDYDSYN